MSEQNIDILEQAIYQNLMKTRILKQSIDELKEVVNNEIATNKSARVFEFALRINDHLNEIYKIMEDLTEFTYDPNFISKINSEDKDIICSTIYNMTFKDQKIYDNDNDDSREFKVGDKVLLCDFPISLSSLNINKYDYILEITKITDTNIVCKRVKSPYTEVVYTKKFFYNTLSSGEYLFKKI